MSTLRFAQLAQSLRTQAVVNRDSDERVKLKLKTEIERLRKQMLERKLQDAEYESMKRKLKEEEQTLSDVMVMASAASAPEPPPAAAAHGVSSAPPAIDPEVLAQQKRAAEARAKIAADRGTSSLLILSLRKQAHIKV
jgi:hypothetical protein